MNDEKGNLVIFDAILAIILLLITMIVISSIMSVQPLHYSENVKDFNTAQDIMETLGRGVNFTDKTFLQEISAVLDEGENSEESVRMVCEISKNKFQSFNLNNYKFCEVNKLGGKNLAGFGDYNKADNISVASRSCGDYCYILYVW